jgi:hypothetical protein
MTTISALPTPPSRSDSINFAARGDAFLTALPQFQTEANAVAAEINAAATNAASSASAAQADRVSAAAAAAAVAAQSPVSNAAAAAASAAAAAVYASTAQATNPDSPIRLNPREISANITIGSDYNAASTGPITIGDGITVTVNNNATWSIT